MSRNRLRSMPMASLREYRKQQGARGFMAPTQNEPSGTFQTWLEQQRAQLLASSMSLLTTAVVGRMQLQDGVQHILYAYLVKHAVALPVGSLSVGRTTRWVRSYGRKALVAYEAPSTSRFFFYKGIPLVFDDGADTPTQLVYLRGSIDPYRLAADAVAWEDQRIHDASSARFAVYRMQGTILNIKRDNGEKDARNNAYEDDGSLYDWQAVFNVLGFPPGDVLHTRPPFGGLEQLALTEEALAFNERVERWLASRTWYADRGIAWRMSGLFTGPPGTGKSSYTRVLAQTNNLPIYTFDLASMTNDSLYEGWERATNDAPCLVLFEDIDRLFYADQTLRAGVDITLDALLNCISGVDVTDGVLLVMTANEPECLPAALRRPGRVDCTVNFPELTEEGRWQLARKILRGWSDGDRAPVVMAGDGETGAEFELRCTELALARYWAAK